MTERNFRKHIFLHSKSTEVFITKSTSYVLPIKCFFYNSLTFLLNISFNNIFIKKAFRHFKITYKRVVLSLIYILINHGMIDPFEF